MIHRPIATLLIGALACLILPLTHARNAPVNFSEDEIGRILQHGPWPPPMQRDPSSRASGNRHAIELGEKLFFDTRLSAGGKVACGSCHQPDRHWTDGQSRGAALGRLERNTPHLLNLRHGQSFGWDGSGDSLWSQIIRPILDSRELDSTARHVAALVRGDDMFSCKFEKAFDAAPTAQSDEAVLVGVAKVLAAFIETLNTERTRFDDFRDALERRDASGMAHYGESAQRGLKIFIGKGNCIACHSGPHFTNGQFHDNGTPRHDATRIDLGRANAVKALASSPFNLLGRYNDDPAGANSSRARKSREVVAGPHDFGAFRVPSLRHAGLTAPYMHNGSIDTLRNVVKHYSEHAGTSTARTADGRHVFKRLDLTSRETDDLLVFLESLTNYRTPTWRETPHLTPCR